MLNIAPNTPSTFGRTIKAGIPFVCTTHARAELALLFKDKSDPIHAKDFLWCVDGMNQAGLSAAVLYQSETKGEWLVFIATSPPSAAALPLKAEHMRCLACSYSLLALQLQCVRSTVNQPATAKPCSNTHLFTVVSVYLYAGRYHDTTDSMLGIVRLYSINAGHMDEQQTATSQQRVGIVMF